MPSPPWGECELIPLGSYIWLHDHGCHSWRGLQLAVGTDVLPSFTSPPPAAARGTRIGSHRSDQAEASVSPATEARRLLETRPEGLQESEPLSSTECESKTHRHRHTDTHTHRRTYMCVYIYVCVHLSHTGTCTFGHRLLSLQTTANPSGQCSPAPPTRMHPLL